MAIKRRSGLFLLEIMISLLIFCVCAMIFTAIFARAAAETTYVRELGDALILSQNEAEMIKSGQLPEPLEMRYYNEKLERCEQPDAVYRLIFSTRQDGGVYYYSVDVYRTSDDAHVYTLDSACFFGEEVRDE